MLYCPTQNTKEAREILDDVFSPPSWPLSLMDYTGTLVLRTLSERFQIGGVTVETMNGYHPGGSTIMRLTFDGRSLVYATDCEPDEDGLNAIAAFSADTDLLLFDGQYTEDEYPNRIGFGHSTAVTAQEVMERSRAGQLLLIHHDPLKTDAELLAIEKRIGRDDVRFAREGETICL